MRTVTARRAIIAAAAGASMIMLASGVLYGLPLLTCIGILSSIMIILSILSISHRLLTLVFQLIVSTQTRLEGMSKDFFRQNKNIGKKISELESVLRKEMLNADAAREARARHVISDLSHLRSLSLNTFQELSDLGVALKHMTSELDMGQKDAAIRLHSINQAALETKNFVQSQSATAEGVAALSRFLHEEGRYLRHVDEKIDKISSDTRSLQGIDLGEELSRFSEQGRSIEAVLKTHVTDASDSLIHEVARIGNQMNKDVSDTRSLQEAALIEQWARFAEQARSIEAALKAHVTETHGRLLHKVTHLVDGIDEIASATKALPAHVTEMCGSVLREVARVDEAATVGFTRLQKPVNRVDAYISRGDARYPVINEVVAMLHLQARIGSLAPLPLLNGWTLEAVSIDRIVDMVIQRRPALIVECGSGMSTVWLAHAQRLHGGRIVSLEHLPEFVLATRQELARRGLSDVAEVRLAPLRDIEISGRIHAWYDTDCTSDLKDIELLLVDGPPKATGPLARYPALPVLKGRLASSGMLVLDDAQREEESEVLSLWQSDWTELHDPIEVGSERTVAIEWGTIPTQADLE